MCDNSKPSTVEGSNETRHSTQTGAHGIVLSSQVVVTSTALRPGAVHTYLNPEAHAEA